MNQMPLIAEAFPPPSPPKVLKPKAPPKRVPTPVPVKLPKTCDQELVALAESRLSPKTIADQRVLATQKATADFAKLRAQHTDPRSLTVAADEAVCFINAYLSALARLADSDRSVPTPAPKPARSVERSKRATGHLQQRRAQRKAS
jgi:hypothetical protein